MPSDDDRQHPAIICCRIGHQQVPPIPEDRSKQLGNGGREDVERNLGNKQLMLGPIEYVDMSRTKERSRAASRQR
jgi:hypothetical protein